MESNVMLYATAALVAIVHTLLGPDHYLPFVAMSRAGRWSRRKTFMITLLCGFGHVLSSAIVGLLGIAFGVAVFKLEWIERFRGNVAGWLLLAFGLVYFLWGVRRAIRSQSHSHYHAHADGVIHAHEHTHHAAHIHVHTCADVFDPTRAREKAEHAGLTPWFLFTIFLFGPCEPLIPVVMYAAARGTAWTVVGVTCIFSFCTIATMLAIVLCSSWIAGITPFHRWQRFGHAAAGLVVLACGVAVQVGF